ncbi:hypothetical protein IQ254_16375 [Nodosilinea sp. LEGE 07088]|nr:hypothetical protein [Nodosilinea sp. LEGE 07088]MBE9138750.1 hypothetical protein [Nodosilinea sp. LEGE 07088]
MASLKSMQPDGSTLPSATNALENREDFITWAEAVKQQMLAALRKRQRN